MLSSCGHMAATSLKKDKACELVKFSQSDDDRGDHDDADKGDYVVLEEQKFVKKSKCFEEESGKPEEVEGRIAKGRNASEEKTLRGSEDASSSSDESVSSDVSWQLVRKRKRQGKQVRKTMKKTHGREVEEQKKHDDERSSIKTDKDKENADKDMEHEICVISWNINKSSARYDFSRDVAQCQVDVAMCQETQNWHEEGAAAEVGWSLFQVEKEGHAAIAMGKKNINLLRFTRSSTRWVIIILESILFLSLYLPHTWGGEVNLEEHNKTLKEVDRNMQDIKQKLHSSGIIFGVPHQESFVGGGTRMYRGNNTKYCEMEAKFESLHGMSGITETTMLSSKDGGPKLKVMSVVLEE